MSIPLPMFLRARLEIKKKILLVFPFSLGLFTMLCAILSKRLSFAQPFSAEWVFWYCREASTAMIVSNVPYSWGLIRRVFRLKSFFGDSTTDGTQRAGLRSIPGVSLARMNTAVSQGKQRQESLRIDPRFAGQKANLSDDELDRETRNHGATESESKEIHVDVRMATSSISDAASTSKPPKSTTAHALDKLYPLDMDDENELDAIDVMRNRQAT